MITALLIIHLLIILAMIGLILIQRNEGGALGIGGSGAAGGLMTARGTANLLTRATAVLAVGFFLMTVVIAGVFKSSKSAQSIVDGEDELGILETTRPVASESKTTDLPAANQAPQSKEATPALSQEKPANSTQEQPKDVKKVK